MSQVYIRAESVEHVGNGVFCINVLSREITDEENDVLTRLFPHHDYQIGEILAKEALISSMTTKPPQSEELQPNKRSRGKFCPPTEQPAY